jgi:hypothetical protein
MTNKPTDETFLVRATDDHFVQSIDGSTIDGLVVPSAAQHFSYLRADQICQSIRRHGYRAAVVTNALGEPVTISDLRGTR